MQTDVRRSVSLFTLAMLPMAIVIGAIAYQPVAKVIPRGTAPLTP